MLVRTWSTRIRSAQPELLDEQQAEEEQGQRAQQQAGAQVVRLGPAAVAGLLVALVHAVLTSRSAVARRCGTAPGSARSTPGLPRLPRAWPVQVRRRGWSGTRRTAG